MSERTSAYETVCSGPESIDTFTFGFAIEHDGPGVSAQPKLVTLPETVAPGPGVSIAPNGFAALTLSMVIVLVPSRPALAPLMARSRPYAYSVNVPLPWLGNP